MLKRRGHGKAVDWYLFGVVMYEMLTGNPPYYANNKYLILLWDLNDKTNVLLNRDDLFNNI